MEPKEKLSIRAADPPRARVLAQLGNRQHDASAALTRAGAATVAGALAALDLGDRNTVATQAGHRLIAMMAPPARRPVIDHFDACATFCQRAGQEE
ncbi:MAG: hypothetical protein ABSC16_14820 [Candidatus Dormibacteria bacterium]|jgi:hypothetical protein